MTRRRYPIGSILFLLFSTFTLLELWILVLLTRATSLGTTILITIVSAIVGASLAKHEGLAVLRRAQKELARGKIPARPLADGVMILIGGALLITPGLITDFIGFTTLLPFCRQFYANLLIRWANRHLRVQGTPGQPGGGGFRFHTFTDPSQSPSSSPSPPPQSPDEEEDTHLDPLAPDSERRLEEWREQVRKDQDQ